MRKRKKRIWKLALLLSNLWNSKGTLHMMKNATMSTQKDKINE